MSKGKGNLALFQGTLTYHLPLKRGPEDPPEMTIVVRRVMENNWHAGISVCSLGDHFVRRIGRFRAGGKLVSNPFTANDPEQLCHQIEQHLDQLSQNRPHTLSAITVQDLQALAGPLSKMQVR